MDTYENKNPEEEKQDHQYCDQLSEMAPVEAEQNEQHEDNEVHFEPMNEAKRFSPYADSPYVMNYSVQEPVKPKKVKKERNKNGVWKSVICAVLALLVLAGACAFTGITVNNYWKNQVEQLQVSVDTQFAQLEQKLQQTNTGVSVSGSPNSSADGGLTPSQVYAKNVESVVLIHNEITAKYNGQTSTSTARGSGFILTEDGYVVTNHHVVEGDGKLSVITYSGEEYSAKLVGFDSTNDVALLKIEADGLQAVTLGSSTALIVGDQVAAIGNPLGELTSTLTVGYISAKERSVTTEGFAINMLQTDAAINSGNSGGPLFNMRGEVIGITTAKYSGTSSSGATIEGVGFAIPIDDVRGLLSDLATYGYVTGAYLGVSVSDMDPEAASYYGMPVGAYVQTVEKGFAAERGGIQPKDIITSINGTRVKNVNELTRALRSYKAGDMATITVYRGGKELILKITLDEKPVNVQVQTTPSDDKEMPEGNFDEWYDYLAPFFGGKE